MADEFLKEYPHPCRAGKYKPLIIFQVIHCFIQTALIFHGYRTDCRKFQNLCAFFPEFIRSSGNQFFWSRDKNFPACKRQFFIPAKFLCQCTHLTNHNDRRRLDPLAFYLFFQGRNCCHDPFLTCCSSLLQDRRGHILFHSCTYKTLADIRKCGHAHQKYKSSLCINKCTEVYIVFFSGSLMSCDDVDRRAEIPVCYRNPVICRYCNGGSNSRNHLIRDPILPKKLQFLSASSEKERISTFQTYHTKAFLCLFQKYLIDIFLTHDVVAGTFANIDQFHAFRNP